MFLELEKQVVECAKVVEGMCQPRDREQYIGTDGGGDIRTFPRISTSSTTSNFEVVEEVRGSVGRDSEEVLVETARKWWSVSCIKYTDVGGGCVVTK